MASTMSDGHSTALDLSQGLYLKLRMTQFSGTPTVAGHTASSNESAIWQGTDGSGLL